MALFGDIPLPEQRDIIEQMRRQGAVTQQGVQTQGMQLANQYQGLLNQFAPEKFTNEASIQRGEISQYPFKNRLSAAQANEAGAHAGLYGAEEKFTPLKYAIEATNSLRANERFGAAFQLKQWLTGLSPADRADWIAKNKGQYDQMGIDIANGPQQQTKNTLLTPQFLGQFGLGLGPLPGNQNPGMPTSAPNAPMQNNGGMLGDPNAGGVPLANAAPYGQPVPAIPNGEMAPNTPPPQNSPPIFGQSTQQAQVPQQQQPAQPDRVFKNFTPEQKQQAQLMAQQSANKLRISPQTQSRAEGGAIMEKWLQDGRAEYAPRMLNAVKYAGALGRGEKWAAEIKEKQPETYVDYLWVQDSFQPNLVNQVKMMEKMGATDSQRDEMHNMVTAVDNIKSTPDTTLKVMNRSLSSLSDIANSTFKVAQPSYPGTLEKIYGLEPIKGDYFSEDYVKSLKKENASAPAPGGRVSVISPDGKPGTLPADQVEAAIATAGYKRG